MNTNDNMAVWKKVCKTDPEYTKHVTQRGGYTSISPQYQVQQATDLFGPYGKGWGFESIDFDYSQLEALDLCLVSAVFFYVQGDQRYTFPIKNAWPVKQGSRVDPDFAKKAETNTMSKALSKLGFGADVFMGQFDDHDYVAQARNESALAKAENKIEVIAEQEREYKEWVDTTIRVIATSNQMHELETVYKKAVRKASLHNDKVSAAIFQKAKDQRKAELEAQQ